MDKIWWNLSGKSPTISDFRIGTSLCAISLTDFEWEARKWWNEYDLTMQHTEKGRKSTNMVNSPEVDWMKARHTFTVT